MAEEGDFFLFLTKLPGLCRRHRQHRQHDCNNQFSFHILVINVIAASITDARSVNLKLFLFIILVLFIYYL
jgi:hypothetical protein